MSDVSIKLGIDRKYIFEKREKVIDQYKLDRETLDKETPTRGYDWRRRPITVYKKGEIYPDQVDNMKLSTFNKLSNNSGRITKFTLFEFVENTELNKVENKVKAILPNAKVEKQNSEIVINTTSDAVFNLIGAKDKDGDGVIKSSELDQNMNVKEVEALAGRDLEVTPDEALKYYLKKKTPIKADALTYDYDIVEKDKK